MRAASLAVKFIVAGVMVCVAAVVIVLMRSEHSTDRIIEQQTMARTAEISARADAAAKLAKIEGGRAAAETLSHRRRIIVFEYLSATWCHPFKFSYSPDA